MNNRVHDSIVEEAVAKERERCAKLCIMRGDIARRSATVTRNAGTYKGVFGKPRVLPKWEARARDHEAIGAAFDVVAACIRKGYDPDLVEHNPSLRAIGSGVHHPGRDPEPGEII